MADYLRARRRLLYRLAGFGVVSAIALLTAAFSVSSITLASWSDPSTIGVRSEGKMAEILTPIPSATSTPTSTAEPLSQPAAEPTRTATPVATPTNGVSPTPSSTATRPPLTPTPTQVASPPAGATPTAMASPTATPSATSTPVRGSGIRVSVEPDAATVSWGSTVTYGIVVTNTGLITDTIYFDKTDSDSQWFTSVFSATNYVGPRGTPAVGPLGPGATGRLSVSVAPKAGVWAGLKNVTMLNAMYGSSNDMASVSMVTTVGAIFGLTLLSSPSGAAVLPGQSVSYAITVTNTGNITDTVSLGITNSNSDSFFTTFDGSSVRPLAPGANVSVPLVVAASGRAVWGVSNTTTISALSSSGTSVSAQTSAVTTVAPSYKIAASVSPNNAIVEPGNRITMSVALTNMGNITDVVRISCDNPNSKDFDVSVASDRVELNPGSSNIVPIYVRPKPNSSENASTTLAISVSGKNGELPPIKLNASATVTVTHGLAISISPLTTITPFRTPITYTVVVTNTGNAADDVMLRTSDEITKFINHIEPARIEKLAPGDSRNLRLIVKPERGVTREFGERVSRKDDKSSGRSSAPVIGGSTFAGGDLELFRLVSTPFDATKVSASTSGITVTAVVTTTSMPPQAKSKDDPKLSGKKEADQEGPNKTSGKVYRPEKPTNDALGSFFRSLLNGVGGSLAELWNAMPWNARGIGRNGSVDGGAKSGELALAGTRDGQAVTGKIAVGSFAEPAYDHKAEWTYNGSNTPHSKSTTTCAFCHEVHGAAQGNESTGSSKLLIKGSKRLTSVGGQPTYINDGIARAQCDSCHDGTGSKYKTERGTIAPQGGGSASSLGGATKKAGEADDTVVGFGYTYSTYTANGSTIDFVSSGVTQSTITVGATQPVSSSHKLEESRIPPYSTGVSADILRCSSCHDPHGVDMNTDSTFNYRQFRQTVTFGGANKVVYFTTNLSVSGPPTETVSLQTGTVAACTSCHNDIGALNHGVDGQNGFMGGHSSSNGVPLPKYIVDGDFMMGDVWTTFKSESYGRIPTERNGGNLDTNETNYPNRYLVCLSCHSSHGSGYETGDMVPLRRPEFEFYELNRDIYPWGWCGACHTAY